MILKLIHKFSDRIIYVNTKHILYISEHYGNERQELHLHCCDVYYTNGDHHEVYYNRPGNEDFLKFKNRWINNSLNDFDI